MNNDLFFSSKSDEWATPQEIFNVLNEEFDFNLDPCATAENAKCPIFYTKEDNGIVKNWGVPSVLQSSVFRNWGLG